MKQKLTALLLVLCMVMAFVPAMAVASAAENTTGSNNSADTWDGATFTEPTSGTGTADDPILLTSAAEFMWFRNKLTDADGLKKSYKLTVNVNFKTVDGFPNASNFRTAYREKVALPASCASGAKPFSGTFDGDNHIISNFYPNGTATQSMFGIVSGGTIKNLIVRDATIEGGATQKAGVICYQLTTNGQIENCRLENATVSGGFVGGIVQELNGGKVSNCSFDGTLSISSGSTNCAAGGIVQDMKDGEIKGCKVSGEMNPNSYSDRVIGSGTLGGIVANIGTAGTTVVIEDCLNAAAISGGNTKSGKTATVGGIVAYIGQDSYIKSITIKNCENAGTLTQATSGYTGGIVANFYRANALDFESNKNTGAITAVTNVGGMFGYMNFNGKAGIDLSFKNCLNDAPILATGDYIGGMIGRINDWRKNINFEGCANYGAVTGANHVGGMVGYTQSDAHSDQNVVLVNSAVYGDVTATSNYAGLLVGSYWGTNYSSQVSATNCVLTGTVTAAENAGGILGYAGYTNATKSTSVNVKLLNSYVDVTVKVPTGATYAATIAGSAQSGLTGVNLTTTDSGISVKVYVGETAAEAPAAYYTYPTDGVLTAQTAELPALDAGVLTNKTAVAKLNAYAAANSLTEWAQGAKAPELTLFFDAPAVPEIGIDGASLTIGENVTLNLFVKTETIRNAGVTVKTISIVNNDGDTIAVGELKGTNYVFTISGIRASEFGTNKIYKVQYTTEETAGSPITCTESITYSPLQYAINMYGKTDKTGLDALLLSIVNYADAAAGTTTAKAAFDEKHADANWTALTALTEIVKEDTGKYTYNAETMPGIGASLTETIALTVYLKDTAYTGVTMKVGDTELTGTADEATQTVKFEGFWATDLYNEITLTFTGAEGTEPLEATTSLVQYLNRYAGNETYAKVATATAQYLYAARNFCLNNQPNA